MPQSNVGGIQIEYDCFGDDNAEVILLISGLGTQMIRWTESFCQTLANHGYRVIRFDNRDAGLSTHFGSVKTPDFASLAHATARGEIPDVPYTLLDMAKDAVGLLDTLGIFKAHLVGRSMGGMIAQLLATEYPDRVLSLTAIMSSTGNRELPQPRSLSDLGSAAAKTPERSIFHRLFGQYLDIDAANPAKSVLVQLFFRYRRPKSDRLLVQP